MNALLRRRVMMQKAVNQMSRFVTGDYVSTNPNGGTNTVNADGSITNTNGSLLFYVTIPITKPIPYKAGDVITFAQDLSYSSLESFRTIKINNNSGLALVNNANPRNYASISVTADEDGIINAIYFGNAGGVQKTTVKPIIYINNILVLGG